MVREVKEILVVDDNEDIRALVLYLLQLEGYNVREAEDGESAIAALRQAKADLLLLDVMMPGISGLELLTMIRSGEVSNDVDIPVIMLTAKTQLEDIDQATQLGATSYMLKPFKGEVLCEKIQEILAYE